MHSASANDLNKRRGKPMRIICSTADVGLSWVREAEIQHDGTADPATPRREGNSAAFVPVQLPAPDALSAPAIRIELRRGATAITVTWPSEAAGACEARMRELLR